MISLKEKRKVTNQNERRLTYEFIDGLSKESYTKQDLLSYIDYLEWNLQDENIHFFCLQYDKQRYIDCLIDTIRFRALVLN